MERHNRNAASRHLSHATSVWSLRMLAMVLALLGTAVVVYTYKASERMVMQYAIEMAEAQAADVTHFRNFYTQEVAPRAVEAGMTLSHDYQQAKGVLPLPATLTIELGHYLSKVDKGTQVQLYSEAPFPWRVADRQLDDFQRNALEHLRRDPSTPYVKLEERQGEQVLRFAQADRMLARCVACHNTHPDSPRHDWKVGDVRGALEVALPVSQWQSTNVSLLNRTFAILLALLLGGFLLVWLILRRLQQSLRHATQLSHERQQAIDQLTSEIADREQAQSHLRLSESKLHSIFLSVPEAIVVADEQGQIVQCNPATEGMFGYSMGELMGNRIEVLMGDAEALAHQAYVRRYLETGQKRLLGTPRVVQARRKDGTSFPLRLTINETCVDQGHYFIAVMQDYTAIQHSQDMLIEARDRAEQANRLRGEFLANMSHEIRTPMNGIVGMTELALNTQNAATQKEYLTLARDSANHLLHIINEILDFSKIEAGAMELSYLMGQPGVLVRQTLQSLAHLAQTKGLQIELDVDPALDEPAWLDPVRLRQVLTNLIGNAIKFTQQGHVRVHARQWPSASPGVCPRMRVQIEDTGIGFDPASTDALFRPFTQADGSVTRLFGGTGLGLAITRRLVELMGGTIEAHSQPGQGASFVFELPLRAPDGAACTPPADEPKSAPPSQAHDASKGQALRVLLVEDHEINLKLASVLLERMGHAYTQARDGQQALDWLEKAQFDVVLMDVMMPVLDGVSALQILREREQQLGRRTPVLMVTAHAMTGDRERFMAAGADGYVSKPIAPDVLEQEMRRVLRSASAPH